VEYGLHVLGFMQTPDKRNRQFITQNLGDFAMRWRDIRFEEPTSLDGDNNFEVITIDDHGNRCSMGWDEVDEEVAAWWCPASELPDPPDPIPDPPDGWRFVKKGEAFDKRAKLWSNGKWRHTLQMDLPYSNGCVYIVPVDPPEPQYRPFANAAEFLPYRDKWWRYKSMTATDYYPPVFFGDRGHGNQHWQDSFENKVFEDGAPFGVKVE
jgi:hypothetical protein